MKTRSKSAAVPKPSAKSAPANSSKKRNGGGEIEKISHEEIERLAHQYWIENGCQDGRQVDDWLRAEHALHGGAA